MVEVVREWGDIRDLSPRIVWRIQPFTVHNFGTGGGHNLQSYHLGPTYSLGERYFLSEVKFQGQPFQDSFLGFSGLFEESSFREFHNFMSGGTTPKSHSISEIVAVREQQQQHLEITQSLTEQPLIELFWEYSQFSLCKPRCHHSDHLCTHCYLLVI